MSLPLVIDRAELERQLAREWALEHPVRWIDERLGEFMWSKQREIIRSVRDNHKTAVHSCHSSGKSWLAARIAAWWIEAHAPGEAFVVTTAPTGRQVRAILWREIGRAHARGDLVGRVNQTEWWLHGPEGNEEMVAFGQKPADMDPDAFQGIHQRFVLVILDEACGVATPIWTAADTLVSNVYSKQLAIGNPDDPNTEFKEVCSPGSGWNVIGIDAFETPNFTDERVPERLREMLVSRAWVEDKLRRWGPENPMFVSKVRGRFPKITTDGLIPMSWVRAAQGRELAPMAPIEIGVDVGGGGDRSVIAVRRGPVVRIARRDQNPNTMETCGNVLDAMRESGATTVKVDEIGIGRGVVDRAREVLKPQSPPRGWVSPVVGVNVGRTARDSEAFANLRAEGFWGLRERFQDGDIDIDPSDEDLAAQLVDLKYGRTSSGKIKIESKEELRRRGKPSPDDADAVMLAFIVPEIEEPKKTPTLPGRRRRA